MGGGSEEAAIAGSQPLTHRMCHQHHLHQLGAAVQLAKINRNTNSGLWFPVSWDSMCTRVANQGWLSTETEPCSAPACQESNTEVNQQQPGQGQAVLSGHYALSSQNWNEDPAKFSTNFPYQ